MSTTWSSFRSSVIASYNDGAQLTNREAAAYKAVSDYVRAELVRTVEGDLQLSKSFRDSYLDAKVQLAGYTITANFATVRAAVGVHISVYNSMAAVSALVDVLVQRGIDDFNGTVAIFDAALVEAAIDLARSIDYYKGRKTTYYTASNFSTQGSASIGQMPEGARPYRWVYQTYYPELADATTYAADDYVTSNDRVYIVITGGTTTDIGDGLTSTDPDDTETLNGLVFQYQEDPRCFNQLMEPSPWKTREQLSCDKCGCSVTDADAEDYTPDQFLAIRASQYLYSLEPRGQSFWVWPKVRDYWQVQLEWDGLQTSFQDSDLTLFGPMEARAAAYYIRSILLRTITESQQNANAAMTLYAMERKRLWQMRDEQRRQLL
jgi:hypothetical protein